MTTTGTASRATTSTSTPGVFEALGRGEVRPVQGASPTWHPTSWKASVTYDQTTITPAGNRIFKAVRDEPNEWLTDDSRWTRPSYENWVISIDGDCEEPRRDDASEMEQQLAP